MHISGTTFQVVVKSCIVAAGFQLRSYRTHQRCQERIWMNLHDVGSSNLLINHSNHTDNSYICPDSFSVAPMMEYTDRHQRTFMRLISKRAVLYTEMVTTNALVRSGDSNVGMYNFQIF